MTKHNQHVFTSELPYEKDSSVTQYLKDNYNKVDSFVMSLGQMTNIPPARLRKYRDGIQTGETKYTKNYLNKGGLGLYFFYIPKALIATVIDHLRALRTISFECDIFFAQHFLPACLAVVLRKMRILKCNKIIFWMFDFFPIPPEITRSLYYRGTDVMQKYLRQHIDEIWYSTDRLREVDEVRFGKLPKRAKTRIVNGLFFRKVETKVQSPSKVLPLKLAFLGSIRKNNAIYESVDVVKYCIENNLKVELHVIGSGPEEKQLKDYVKKSKVGNVITFYGFEDSGEEIAKIFSKCHLGMALYPADPYSPNWYLTSGKFRRFIAQGLPVVTSTVPYFSKYINEYKAGFVVDNNPKEVYKVLSKVYNNPALLKTLKRGVDKLYNKYSADKVLDIAFSEK